MNGRSLVHYGIPRRSGRYKWGSGKNPFHHGQSGGSKKTKKQATPLTDEEKDLIIRRGDTRSMLKNKEQFTDDEFRRAANRIDIERKISSQDFANRHKSMKTVQDIVKSLDETSGGIERISKRGAKLGKKVILG